MMSLLQEFSLNFNKVEENSEINFKREKMTKNSLNIFRIIIEKLENMKNP